MNQWVRMHQMVSKAERRRRTERGFTLAEVVMAVAVLSIALVGFAGALAVQRTASGIVGGVEVGRAAVSRGRYVSMATFLAQDRLEQIKRLDYTLAVDQIGAGSPPAGLPNEDYGTIAGYQDFRREVVVQNGVPGSNRKLVTVTVRFHRFNQDAQQQEAIVMRTIVAARP